VISSIPPSLEQDHAGSIRLYDLRAIDIATFLSSWFAGAFLLSRNLRALGRLDDARNVLLVGFLALFPLAFLLGFIVVPEAYERALSCAVQTAQVGLVHLTAKRLHAHDLESHAAAGGGFFSRWRAAGVALLLLPVAFAVFFGVVLAFPNLPALAE